MAKDPSYELFPGIRVTDADDVEYNHGKRLDISKFKQFDRTWHQNGYPDQEVRDKIAKNNGLAVCRSWSDVAKKQMCYEVLVNANTTRMHVIGYDDICKEYGWKSFKWSDDEQTIIPKF